MNSPILVPPLVCRGDGTLSDTTLRRVLAAGTLVTVLPGVHLRREVAHLPEWRALAVASWRPDATFFGSYAASHTFWPELPVDVVDVACRTTVERPGLRFVRREIPPELVVCRGGMQFTGPALTALDLAVETDGESIDNVLRAKMARIRDLNDALAATPYRRGNRERRRLLLNSRAEPWSVAERMAHTILHDAGITGWRANVPIQLAGQHYFLDIAFGSLKLVLEIDGRLFHTKPDVFESDRIRQNALVLDDWTVLRYTYRRLKDDPGGVLAETRAGMELAARRIACACA